MLILNDVKKIFNRDIITTLINFFLKLLLKPIILLFVPLFLIVNEQGYWYTFASIAALTTFADLGFTTIITQFSAHEYAYVRFDKNKRVFYDDYNEIKHLGSLFRFMIKWSGTITFIACIIIFIVGTLVFGKEVNGISWMYPWLIYSIATGYNFILQTIFSFFEGCDQIATIQQIKISNDIIYNLVTLLLLYLGYKLYALGIALFVSCLISTVQVVLYFGKSILQLVKSKGENEQIWFKRILKLLWKYAISWTSGYFIFQIYTPLMFALYGAEIAGIVGYTLTVISSIVSIANAWSYVSIPKLNMLTAKKSWSQMDLLFKCNLFMILGTYTIGIITYTLLLKTSFINHIIGKRVLGLYPTFILIVAYACQIIISYLAVYLRAHREEPFMMLSLFSAIFNIVVTCVFVKLFGYNFAFMGFLLSFTITLPWAISIFKQKRLEWHGIS